MHLKKVAIVFHNGSNNDYHFIIEELAKEKFRRRHWKINKIYNSNGKWSYKSW